MGVSGTPEPAPGPRQACETQWPMILHSCIVHSSRSTPRPRLSLRLLHGARCCSKACLAANSRWSSPNPAVGADSEAVQNIKRLPAQQCIMHPAKDPRFQQSIVPACHALPCPTPLLMACIAFERTGQPSPSSTWPKPAMAPSLPLASRRRLHPSDVAVLPANEGKMLAQQCIRGPLVRFVEYPGRPANNEAAFLVHLCRPPSPSTQSPWSRDPPLTGCTLKRRRYSLDEWATPPTAFPITSRSSRYCCSRVASPCHGSVCKDR